MTGHYGEKTKRYEEILKEKSIVANTSHNEHQKREIKGIQLEKARAIDLNMIGKKPRQYQLEAFHQARTRNIVMCADTGAGKTLTAILLIQNFHRENGGDDATGPHSSEVSEYFFKKSVFLAPTVELLHQQCLRIGSFTGLKCEAFVGIGLDKWSDEEWKYAIKDVECMAFTPQAFVNLIARGHQVFNTSSVGLIIFDEAHHAQKNHPYVRVVNSFEQSRSLLGMKKDVKVFGMTASPTKPCFQNLRCEPHVCDVDSEEIQNASAVPPTKVQLYFTDHSNCKEKVKECLMDLMKLLFSTCLTNKDGKYQPVIPDGIKEDDDEGETTLPASNYNKCIEQPLRDTFTSLGTWPTLALALLLIKDQQNIMRRTASCKDEWYSMDEKFSGAHKLISSTFSWATPNFKRLCSAKIGALVGLLRRRVREYSGKEPFQCMVFVQRRLSARVLAKVLSDIFESETDEAMRLLKVGYVVGGETRSSSNALDLFRNCHIQVLITTAVCCEGIDIPAVSCVVCMDDIPNSRSLIHTRGRVRLKGGIMVILCPHGDDKDTTRIAEMLKEAKLIRRNDLSEEKGSFDKDQPLALKYPKLVYRFPSTGAVLDMDIAVPLLTTALDCLGALFSPLYVIEERKFDVDIHQSVYIPPKYSATLVLPNSVEAQLKDVPLPANWEPQIFFPRKKEARAAEAMRVCLLMHASGLLSDKLEVVKILPDVQKLGWWDSTTLVVDSASISIPCCPTMEDLGLQPLRPDAELLAWHLEGTDGGLYFAVDKGTTDISHVNAISEFLGCVSYQVLPGVSKEELEQLKSEHEVLLSCIMWSETSKTGRWSTGHHPPVDDRGYLLVWKPNGPETRLYFAPTEKENDFRFVVPLMDINGPGIVSYKQFREVGSTNKLENRIAHVPKDLEQRFGDNASLLQDLIAKHAPLQHKIGLMHSSKSCNLSGMDDRALIPCLLFDLPRMVFNRKCGAPLINYVTLALEQYCELSPISKEHYEAGVKCLPLLLLAERALMSATLSRRPQLNISPRIIDKALKNPDNEVLEFVGDAWLKLYASLSSFAGSEEEVCMQEYTMTLIVHNMVSNMRLVKAAVCKGLDHYVHFPEDSHSSPFGYWCPPGFLPSTYQLKWKKLADIVEALIGAAFLEKGELGPVPFLHWLDLGYLKQSSFLDAALAGRMIDDRGNVMMEKSAADEAAGLRSNLEHKLEEKLGYRFNDLRLLREALTHPSWTMLDPRCRDYQRLEFLGDSILELVVTAGMIEDEMIDMEALGPGLLSNMREFVVCNATLAHIALELQLDLHIRGTPEVCSAIVYFSLRKTSNPPKALADVVEALIAAVWIDSGCNFQTLLCIFYYPFLMERTRGRSSDKQGVVLGQGNCFDDDTDKKIKAFGDINMNDLVYDVTLELSSEFGIKMLPNSVCLLAENLKQAIEEQMTEAIAKKEKK